MTYLKPIGECWRYAEQKTESLPFGTRTISKLGLTALKYVISGNAEQYSSYLEAIDNANKQNKITTQFYDELAQFETPFGNLENAIEADIL